MKNIDETGKDLNSLPMISGNSPSYQGFSDRARSLRGSGACLVQLADIGAGQHQMDGGGQTFELVDRGRAGNWGRYTRAGDQPCQRDRGWRAAVPPGDPVERVQNPQTTLVQILFDPAAARLVG